jgi:DNA helicase-2/ATP-dependent DNA helicase PcrA
VRGGERFFARKEVRDALVLLRGGARSMTEIPLADAVRDVLVGAGWSPEPPAARGAVRERWDSLQAIVALADDLAQAGEATIATLVAELDERASAQHAPAVDGVTLASLHAAKGLEWDAVFLVGLSEGLMPISLAETDPAIAEERRLLYVGITRAREHLELSHARSRAPGGRATRRHSRFLAGIWPDDAGPARRRTSGTRSAPQLTGDHDPALFESLRQWRARVAAEVDRPAYTVLVDATLAGIAEVRPRSVAELVQVRGIGPAKIELYGRALLAIVAEHTG